MQTEKPGPDTQPARWIDRSMVSDLFRRAVESPRLRMNLNFHRTLDENPHRFLNAMLRGTYVRPHRHLFPPKAESFVLLEGAVLFLIFDEGGEIASGRILVAPSLSANVAAFRRMSENVRTEFRADSAWGVDLDPGLWHTLLPLSERALIFEVKPGPYEKAGDKEFPGWAPAEKDANTEAYLQSLYRRCLLPETT